MWGKDKIAFKPYYVMFGTQLIGCDNLNDVIVETDYAIHHGAELVPVLKCTNGVLKQISITDIVKENEDIEKQREKKTKN